MYLPETEAVDTYSLGNIFFVLLSGRYPFRELSRKATRKAVAKGERPEFDEELIQSTDQNVQALIEAAKMCWVHDPLRRATARQVQQYLQSKLKQHEL